MRVLLIFLLSITAFPRRFLAKPHLCLFIFLMSYSLCPS